ncbi:MAG: lytic transglycosylase domain-containing protein [Spirochaetes bacterium]|jgi:soluble lytic murein transglycosylase-like protein|nr:lytic transglycosylase domain-containing protein [Spirochaetota bacterium]
MTEDMFAVMQRIEEIKSRFGLKRHNPKSSSSENRASFDRALTENINQDRSKTSAVSGNPKNPGVEGINRLAEEYAGRNGIPASLVKAVIDAESGYNPRAVSGKGAKGLMQLMPSVIKDMGVKDPYEPEENIKAGVEFLSGLLKNYKGDYKKALSAYNAGKKTVDEKGGADYRETRDFVGKVIANYLKNK